MAKRTAPRVSVIGTGRVGSALAKGMFAQGYTVASLINRSGSPAIGLARAVKCKSVSTHVGDVSPASDIILLTVSDDAIAGCAEELSRVRGLKWKSLFVAHASGVKSSRLLKRLEAKGASVASMHPIQTFPKSKKAASVRGIYFGIEGTAAGIARAERIVRDLGSRSVVVPEESKPLYHSACVLASGYLVVLLNAIAHISRRLDLRAPWTDVFGPLLTSAMENSIRYSPSAALTGPAVRGDADAVGEHLRALGKAYPQFLPLYVVAGIESARIARDGGAMSDELYKGVVRQFRDAVRKLPTTTKRKGTS